MGPLLRSAVLFLSCCLLLLAGQSKPKPFRRDPDHPHWHHGAFHVVQDSVRADVHRMLHTHAEAEFTLEELDTLKRSLNLKDGEESELIVSLAKKRRGDKSYIEQSKDEQAISESTLNKLVSVADLYNLKEAEPPSTLTCELWS